MKVIRTRTIQLFISIAKQISTSKVCNQETTSVMFTFIFRFYVVLKSEFKFLFSFSFLKTFSFIFYYPRRLASEEGIVVLGVCVCVSICPPSGDCIRRNETLDLGGEGNVLYPVLSIFFQKRFILVSI